MSKFHLTEKQLQIWEDLRKTRYKHICLYGGARSGKTMFLMFKLFMRCLQVKSRHVIIRDTFSQAKKSIVEDTIKKLLNFDQFSKIKSEISINYSELKILFPNGSTIYCYGVHTENAVQNILGTEYSTIYYNECSTLQYNLALDPAVRSRLAEKSGLITQFYYDFNPPAPTHWTYKYFIEKVDPTNNIPLENPESFYVSKLVPLDNMDHLPKDIMSSFGSVGTESYRRYALGEFVEDSKNALWKFDMIANSHKHAFSELSCDEVRNRLKKVVIGVDPAVSSDKHSDLTGIIVAGYDGSNFYVLEDQSGKYSPDEWSKKVEYLYNKWQANTVIVEKNQGGDLIKSLFRGLPTNMHIQAVHAKVGKAVRAEPVVALYERNLVYHITHYSSDRVGCNKLLDLENQLLYFVPQDSDFSPDRLDAMVYALSFLSERRGGTVYTSDDIRKTLYSAKLW